MLRECARLNRAQWALLVFICALFGAAYLLHQSLFMLAAFLLLLFWFAGDQWLPPEGVPHASDGVACAPQPIPPAEEAEIAELEARIARLEASNSDLSQFAHIAAHDLRSPMRGLKSLCDYLRDDLQNDDKEAVQRSLALIEESAQKTISLVDNLLEYTQAADTSLRPQRFPLQEAVDTACANLAADDVVFEVSGELPEVYADRVWLVQILQHLFNNAIKFQQADKACLIAVYPVSVEGMSAFVVEDNGIGIATEYLHEIFTAFKKLHSSAEYSGAGLGLATVKRLVELHGGQVHAESEPGKGTRVIVALPDQG